MRIACLGDCGVDRYVDRGLDRPGGCTLNLAVNLARLTRGKAQVAVVSAVGNDDAGSAVHECLAKEKIEPHVQRLNGATPMQTLEVLSDGERRFVSYDAGVLPRLVPDAAQRAMLAEADWVVTVLYRQVDVMMRDVLKAKRRGKLAVDFMDWQDYDLSTERIAWLLDQTEVAFFGLRPEDRDAALALGEHTKKHAGVVVVTMGGDGGVAFQGGRPIPFMAEPVPVVVDTTGAGDAFAAAFLSRHVVGEPVAVALDFAARHAARVVQRIGAF